MERRKVVNRNKEYWIVQSVGHPNAHSKYGDILEHRLVVESRLGRYLLKTEIVHHINGDGLDNRDENLEVMLRSDHSKLHAIGHCWNKREYNKGACMADDCQRQATRTGLCQMHYRRVRRAMDLN